MNPVDTAETIHLRCGSDIKQSLSLAGFQGRFLEVSDPLCMGPVQMLPEADFIKQRAEFLCTAYDLEVQDEVEKLALARRGVTELSAADHLVLWFEHDSYDQLILAYVLWLLHDMPERPKMELVCVEDFPVEPRFIGIGQLTPDQLKQVWKNRVPVTDQMLQEGATCFKALCKDAPDALATIALEGRTRAVPAQARAVERHLAQLPHLVSGLSLTAELSLQGLQGGGLSAGKLFRWLMLEREPLPYLGDSMFWDEIKPLVEGGAIRITAPAEEWFQQELELTPLGEELLEGKADWLRYAPQDRWVGGICIKPVPTAAGAPNWRRTDVVGEHVLK